MPRVRQLALANGRIIVTVQGRIDRHMQGDDGVAALGRGLFNSDRLLTCLGEGNTVPRVRQLALADRAVVVAVQRRVDCHMQGDDGVAALGRGLFNRDRLLAGVGERHAMPGVRQLALTNGRIVVAVQSRVHRHVQGDDGVAALGRGLFNRDGLLA